MGRNRIALAVLGKRVWGGLLHWGLLPMHSHCSETDLQGQAVMGCFKLIFHPLEKYIFLNIIQICENKIKLYIII